MSFSPPTESELAAVSRLRQKLEEDKPDGCELFRFTDTGLLRFYRGRKQDEEKAYRALEKHLNWRKEHNVDDIHNQTELFSKELNSGKIHTDYKDKDGKPCIFVSAGKHNKNDRDLDELKLTIIYTLENVLKKAKPDDERMNICFDLSDFSYSCMDYDAIRLLVNILQFNYPDTLNVALVINSPLIFSACWAIIRPWLDPVTVSKVAFVNSAQFKKYLDENSVVAT
jgi:hypothetical protein